MGDKTILLQDMDEEDIMNGDLINCFESSCSWAKDGEQINFHIKTNTNENEINKLKNHIENKINNSICKENDNHHRIKIKVEYIARNIIKNIYSKYNRPSTHHAQHIKQKINEPKEEPKDVRKKLFDTDDDELSLQNLL